MKKAVFIAGTMAWLNLNTSTVSEASTEQERWEAFKKEQKAKREARASAGKEK